MWDGNTNECKTTLGFLLYKRFPRKTNEISIFLTREKEGNKNYSKSGVLFYIYSVHVFSLFLHNLSTGDTLVDAELVLPPSLPKREMGL